MSSGLAALRKLPAPDARLRVPTREEWLALPEAARLLVERRIYDALSGDVLAMSESTRHFRPKANAYKDLEEHFHRSGRKMFLACELAVLYPGEDAFAPDLLAVADVPDAARDRDSWRVVQEGRGIDLILELRNKGKVEKDLVENVRTFARLGIPEYFAFDCQGRVLRGWRRGAGGAAYLPIVPQGGQLPSQVLGLELAVVDGRLRFFVGQALVPDSRELIVRLQGMVDDQQRSVEEAERQREESERQLRQIQSQVAERVLARMSARGIALEEEQRQVIQTCTDLSLLMTWLERAQTVPTAEELLRQGVA